jgi:hypothetical protein
MQAITVTVSSTAADLQLPPAAAATIAPSQQQQQPPGKNKPGSRQLRLRVHRLPDTAAIQRFTADEVPEALGQEEAEDFGTQQDEASRVIRAAVSLAPRIVGDPAVVSHQLAGWVRIGGDGVEEGAEEGFDDEELLGPGGAVDDEKDMMDEEEWI